MHQHYGMTSTAFLDVFIHVWFFVFCALDRTGPSLSPPLSVVTDMSRVKQGHNRILGK